LLVTENIRATSFAEGRKLKLVSIWIGIWGFYRVYVQDQGGTAYLEMNGPWGQEMVEFESLDKLWAVVGHGGQGWETVH